MTAHDRTVEAIQWDISTLCLPKDAVPRSAEITITYENTIVKLRLDESDFGEFTNFQKLRHMSKERFANFLRRRDMISCGACAYNGSAACAGEDDNCINGILDWLESEAEE